MSLCLLSKEIIRPPLFSSVDREKGAFSKFSTVKVFKKSSDFQVRTQNLTVKKNNVQTPRNP